MIRRDDLLNTKRYEIENLVAGRKRKLIDLWKSSVACSESEKNYRDAATNTANFTTQLSLDRFLEDNDITQGRCFQVESISDIHNAPKVDAGPDPEVKGSAKNIVGLRGLVEDNQNAESSEDDNVVDRDQRETPPVQKVSSASEPILEDGLILQDKDSAPINVYGTTASDENIATVTIKDNLPTTSSSDPTAQLLSEAARGHVLPNTSIVAGTKRDYDAAMSSPEDTQIRRRKDEMRQPMRIDTNVQPKRPAVPAHVDSPAPSATPSRMTTRVASGAIRQRSVSEITGEVPRISHARSDSRDVAVQTPRTATAATPSSAMFQLKLQELKDKDRERSKMSTTVVFPRPSTATIKPPPDTRPEEVRRRERLIAEKDYLVPLFYAQASAQTPKLNQLVTSSKKVLSTNDHKIEYREDSDCRILKRIYHLQNNNRWALRQIERGKEPNRLISHWDAVLGEAKWMRTDFREERRWKIAAAKNLADWCAEYFASNDEERMQLRVQLRKPRFASVANQTTPMSLPNASGIPPSEPTPDLIPSTADDISEPNDDEALDLVQTIAPAALFSLPPMDVVINIQRTAAADKILAELPLCPIWTDAEDPSRPYSVVLDSRWKTPVAPLTKFVTGKLLLKNPDARKRKSRFDCAAEEEDNAYSVSSGSKTTLQPEQNNVALFQSENHHIVQRLHAAHAFRPPSEFAMPVQGFFEARTSSQWTPNEDNQLRRLVQEYEYNWSLISSSLATPSLFTSSAERRTPWECFERWVSFEGLPGDMSKHQYFRAWNSRRETAREHLEQQNEAQLQNPNTAHIPIRRKTSDPVSVDRKKQARYFNQFRVMVAIKAKREKAANKPATAPPPKKTPAESETQARKMTKPSEFSQHKHKQEVDFRESRLRYQRHVIEQQRAANAARIAQQNGVTQGVATNGAAAGLPSQSSRPAVQMNGTVLPNGGAVPRPMTGVSIPGLPLSNGQMNLRGGMTPQQAQQFLVYQQQQQQQQQHNSRLAMQADPNRGMVEAARLAAEQQRLAQQRQQQFANGGNVAGFPTGAMFPSIQAAANGQTSPAINGAANRLSSSPGSIKGLPTQPLSDGTVTMLTQLSTALRRQHPTATAEQIMAMATASLKNHVQNRTTAMNIANGNSIGIGANGTVAQPMQSYQNMLRQQQLLQAAQQNRVGSAGRSGSPSSRPGSQGGSIMQRQSSSLSAAANQSPRPSSAQMAGSS